MDSPDAPTCIRCAAPSRRITVPRDRHGVSAREVRECTSAVCGIGFTWPPPDDAVDAAPASGAIRGLAARVAGSMAAASVAPLADALPDGSLVVDIGAGTGLRAKALAARG